MSNEKLTNRQRLRKKSAFPAGMFVGLLTAVCITLTGVVIGLDPLVIVFRAGLSAIFLGMLVSFGMSVVRMMHAESKARRTR